MVCRWRFNPFQMSWCLIKKIHVLILFIFIQGSAFSQTTLVPFGSSWKYKDDGSNQGTAWRQVGFDDSAWSAGSGQLGYGDGDETQILNACGTPVQFPSCSNKYIGYYFRKTLNIPDVSVFKSFTFEMYRDDGVVVYVNGTEVYRDNMPAGTIAYNTLASANAPDDGNSITDVTITLAASQFQSGNNDVAVEVHQSAASSGDLSWDMKLTGIPPSLTLITRGPYLQKATSTSMIVRWYTDDLVDSEVKYGTDAGNLSQSQIVSGATNNHSVQLTNLTPYTKYYYSIGSTTSVLKSGPDNYFLTSPLSNAENKYTFWVTGDVGNNSTRQRDVRDRFNAYMGSNVTNGWLLLGDNAYDNGTDGVYTTNFFEIYQNTIMGKTPLWPATGNHEYANSTARQIDHNIPYFGIFDLPTSAEAGGAPSNSEAYYSWDYGNIHFVALDSYIIENGTSRLYDISGPQVLWLKQDLAANTKKWTIVYFHHPPFTMGSHNSDTEDELRLIRENIVPILEQYDVDLVLSGHSHDYERSKLQKGYVGLEASFDPLIHDVSQSSGKYDGTTNSCVYVKDSPTSFGGTVYTVAGSGGKLDAAQASFPHSAMYYSNQTVGGSLIIEIEANRLDLKWLSEDGVIRDKFTMMKEVNKVSNINVIDGESVNLEASWVGQYDWGHSVETSRIVSITPPSSATYTVTDQYQCITDTYNITVVSTPLSIDIPSVGFVQTCAGSNVNVSYTTSGVFSVGNIFTLQLSDAVGSFTSPISIGTLSGTSSGTISGVIPTNTSTSSAYKFRIVSSDPVFAGSVSSSITVNSLPLVSAASQVCVGSTITLSPTTGGSWLSSDNSKATVTNAGVVTGVAAGSVTFTFTNTSTGCSNTTTLVTVNALPVVSASSQVCVGSTIMLSPTTGGTWASSDNSKATVTNAGVVTGVAAGSATFTFTNTTTGCSKTTLSVTVNALPVVSAASQVCVGSTITLSPTTGGTWTSSDNSKATVTNAGVVTGVAAGGATFTFTNTTTGCSKTTPSVTVNALPVVSAASKVCVGSTITLSPTTGGTWTSSDNSKATVTNAGVVTGISAGSATFTFTNSTTGCSNTTPSVAVNSLPVISAASQVCIGSTINLSPTTGGTWASSDNSKATVTNAGVVTGVAAGSATFTFTNTTTGCSKTTPSVTVNALPVVSAASQVCVGSTITLSPTTGGTWASSDNSKATVTNAGVVTGVAAGSATFTFTNTTTGCSNTTTLVTVNALPVVSGASQVCVGSTITLSPITGGTWVSSDNSKASVTNAGVVTGGASGSASFTFTNTTTGCSNTTSSVTVSSLPSLPVISDATYCMNTVATALTATATVGHTLQWYGTNSTGGTAIITAPTPSTASTGTTLYYVSQKNNTTGCEGQRSSILVTINGLPVLPSVSDISYCQNATVAALTANASSGHTLLWYGTSVTGGTSSITAPTPSTSALGTTDYYVSQLNTATSCEGARAKIIVTVNDLPQAPTVSDIGYCETSSSVALTATALSGHVLQWYGTSATGGIGVTTAPTPSTSATGTTTYYVSQKNTTTGCESLRSSIIVTVNPLPTLPVVSDITYCQNTTATTLTATALSGHTLLWYGTNATGGTSSVSAPIPSTAITGTTKYYVSQVNNTTNCESDRASISVIVTTIPSAPIVSDAFYCQNATAAPLTATPLSGHILQWYGTNATGGSPSTSAPTPSTSVIGNVDYFVSQLSTTAGCIGESDRAKISVVVNSSPTPPVVSDITYCKGSSATALTAIALSGHTLQWYGTNASGGTSSSTAPIPSTTTAGTTSYYVSQHNTATGCESERASIAVTIKATPKPTITATGAGTENVLLNSSAGSGNQWFKDGVAIVGATSQAYSVLGNGVYQVSATVDGCVSELSEPFTVMITGVEDVSEPIKLKLYPIPAHGAINIQLTGVTDDVVSEVLIFDISGRLVDKHRMKGKESTLIIEEYPAGEYFLRISNKSSLTHSRVIKY